MMRGLCSKCEKRNTCTTLCKKAEAYVNRDSVVQKELLPSKPLSDKMANDICWEYINFDNPNVLKSVIIDLHKSGMPNRQIMYHVPCSRQYIIYIIKRYVKD